MNEYTFERINHTFDTNEMDLVLVTVNKVFFLLPILHSQWNRGTRGTLHMVSEQKG